jgi:hypothetical protein
MCSLVSNAHKTIVQRGQTAAEAASGNGKTEVSNYLKSCMFDPAIANFKPVTAFQEKQRTGSKVPKG